MNDVALLAGNKFLHDTALALLWGGGGYIEFVAPAPLSGSLAKAMKPATWTAVIVVAITAVATIPLSAASIAAGIGSVDPDLIQELLSQTSVGHQMLLQALFATLLATATWLSSPRTTLAIAGLMLCQLAFSGHGTDETFGERLIQSAHILCGCAWLGALLPFFLTLREVQGSLRQQSMAALRRFSELGHIAVAGALAFGLATSWAITGRSPASASSSYDFAVLLKIGLVGTMAAVAVANRYWLVPSWKRGSPTSLALLARTTVAEVALGMTAIATVAIFSLLDPH
ncbi:CopD family protein [Rhizobium leguminosarum]|uniref:CopD family protein n=1 Tax=Rhizobium leguminosarum TaxID=384 RepID=UPI000FEC919B|nr:CopD family protein [Rhizobium leguminosarum]RWX36673.1 copper resistance D family protein [Rhizobium leguminosarum]